MVSGLVSGYAVLFTAYCPALCSVWSAAIESIITVPSAWVSVYCTWTLQQVIQQAASHTPGQTVRQVIYQGTEEVIHQFIHQVILQPITKHTPPPRPPPLHPRNTPQFPISTTNFHPPGTGNHTNERRTPGTNSNFTLSSAQPAQAQNYTLPPSSLPTTLPRSSKVQYTQTPLAHPIIHPVQTRCRIKFPHPRHATPRTRYRALASPPASAPTPRGCWGGSL